MDPRRYRIRHPDRRVWLTDSPDRPATPQETLLILGPVLAALKSKDPARIAGLRGEKK